MKTISGKRPAVVRAAFVAVFVAIFSFIVNSLIGFNKVRVRRIE